MVLVCVKGDLKKMFGVYRKGSSGYQEKVQRPPFSTERYPFGRFRLSDIYRVGEFDVPHLPSVYMSLSEFTTSRVRPRSTFTFQPKSKFWVRKTPFRSCPFGFHIMGGWGAVPSIVGGGGQWGLWRRWGCPQLWGDVEG